MLSESSIRIFLARVTNKLTLPTAAQTISVEFSGTLQQPRFLPEASHMQLPKCPSLDSFASRMAVLLRLGDYMSHTEAQREDRLSQEDLRDVIGARGGESRAGVYYRCVCGYPYAVVECGGPIQRAPCARCQRNIGGEQHRLQAGNQPAGLDGAQGPAWPQGQHRVVHPN
ncbi:NFX1-type zinc finger-containing protein 1 [Trebouxia sp. C0010 RCD-2024]